MISILNNCNIYSLSLFHLQLLAGFVFISSPNSPDIIVYESDKVTRCCKKDYPTFEEKKLSDLKTHTVLYIRSHGPSQP